MAKYAKQKIMDAFLELLNHKSMDKLTVKDVIELADVNRNTFYYHFEDIYDLLHQVFQKKFEDFCEERDEEESFYDAYIGAAEVILNNKRAMNNVYHSRDRELIIQYMENVANLFVEQFVSKAAKPYNLSEEGIQYLTRFYGSSIVGNTIRWIRDGMPPYRERYIFLFSKSFEDGIEEMIQSFQRWENKI